MSDTRPVLLDLFCGAGGAAVGYHRAGFDVLGVDVKPRHSYPFPCIHADALVVLRDNPWLRADAIHASPPCQPDSRMRRAIPTRIESVTPDVRSLLQHSGKPYILEGVEFAPLLNPVVLCGSMFSIRVRRHRLFESNIELSTPNHECWGPQPDIRKNREMVATVPYVPFTGFHDREFRSAAGLEWMSLKDARQAIPPAYTEYIGTQLLSYLA